ncbi:MAG: hypothetical protein JW969_17785 [Spirochaetales bacterium]|nr:hypothetical protein [Spirochaetales bacterium]
MQKQGFFAIFFIILILFTGIMVVYAEEKIDAELVDGSLAFTLDLYRQIGKDNETFFFSPYSIYLVLNMLDAGARGRTADQLTKALGLNQQGDAALSGLAELKNLLAEANQEGKVRLNSVNSLWPQTGFPFKTDYLDSLKGLDAEINPVDYKNNPQEARNRINKWVEDNTNNRIKNIVPDGAVDRNTLLALANAIYFKAEWKYRFDKEVTEGMPFFIDEDHEKKVPMMSMISRLDYYENESVQVLELPYYGNRLSMLIILPLQKTSLSRVEKSLSVGALGEWRERLFVYMVTVSLPKLSILSDLRKMKNYLEALGINDAFRSSADFSGIVGKGVPFYITSFFHKAFVEVNEEGSEAAAATVATFCFPAGTQVHTARGPRNIETIRPGDKVYSYDFIRGEWVSAAVSDRKSEDYSGDMITLVTKEGSVKATGNHPFFVLRGKRLQGRPAASDIPAEEPKPSNGGRWVEARNLIAGDVLLSKSGGETEVISVSMINTQSTVYNLKVELYRNYAVGNAGYLVHNKGAPEPQPVIMNVNHPFIFLIQERSTGLILFMGRVTDPFF